MVKLYIDRLLVSSALFTPSFTLIGNDYFWSCHTNLASKSSKKTKKILRLKFRGYLGENESDSHLELFGRSYALLRHGQCFQFSCPNLQCLTRFDFKNLCPLFGWPSLYKRAICENAFNARYTDVLDVAS